VAARSKTGIVGSNPTGGVDICLHLICVCCRGYVAALRRADPSSKESYQLSVRFIISELILNGNRPESLIRQGRKRTKYTYMNCGFFDILCIVYENI
jgi:hypothetical protein